MSLWFGARTVHVLVDPLGSRVGLPKPVKLLSQSIETVLRKKRNSSQEGLCVPKGNTPALSSALSAGLCILRSVGRGTHCVRLFLGGVMGIAVGQHVWSDPVVAP